LPRSSRRVEDHQRNHCNESYALGGGGFNSAQALPWKAGTALFDALEIAAETLIGPSSKGADLNAKLLEIDRTATVRKLALTGYACFHYARSGYYCLNT
jgi:hypothetical protein